MSLWSSVKTVWSATSEGSRALSAAQDAYHAGEPVAGIIRAWAAETETEVDDKVLAEVVTYATLAIDWIHRAAVMLVQVAIRLEMQIPALVARYIAAVNYLERCLVKLRAAAIVLEGSVDRIKQTAQQMSVALTHVADAIERLK